MVGVYDLDEVPFAATSSTWTDPHRDSILVPKRAHLASGQIDVLRAVVRSQESESIAMRLNHAGHEIEMPRQAVLSCAVTQ